MKTPKQLSISHRRSHGAVDEALCRRAIALLGLDGSIQGGPGPSASARFAADCVINPKRFHTWSVASGPHLGAATDTERIPLRVAQNCVPVAIARAGRPQRDEAGNFESRFFCYDVKVYAVPLLPRPNHQVEAKAGAGTFHHNGRVRLGGEAEGSQARDLIVVVRRDSIAIEHRRPEPGQTGRVISIDHDILQFRHRPSMAIGR